MPLSKPTNGSNADYANRIGLLFDAFNNGNYAFPATQVPSADANTLDDYEEGTWTPSVGGTATYTTQTGRYTKIGRVAMVQVLLTINLIGTGATGLISGLPFTASGTQAGSVGTFAGAAANFVFVSVYINGGSTQMGVATATAAATSLTTPGPFLGNSASIFASANYIT